MKFSKYKYIVSALILLSIGGCSQEEFVDDGSSLINGVKVSLNIEGASNSLKSNSETLVDNESTISNLYLLFYKNGTAIRDVVECFIPQTSLNNHGQWTGTLELPAIVSGQKYDVYAFANIPQATASKLSATVTRGVVRGLAEELSARQDSLGRSISFSATTTYTGGQKESLDIKVKRTVAKLQVGIDMSGLAGQWKLESVKVLNEMQKTSYIGTNPTTPRVSSYNAFNVEGKDSVYYYLYENAESATEANQVKLQINIANETNDTRSYTAIVNKKGASKIVRNKIYKSKILLIEGSEPIELSLDTLAWDRKDINVDIPSVYLDLPSDTLELSHTGSGELYFKSNADSVTVTWKDDNNLLVNSSRGPSKVIYPIDILGNYKIDFFMLPAVQTATKDIITLSAGNLVKEVVATKSASDYLFNIFISPMDKHPDVIKTYNYQTDKNIEIEISSEISNVIKPWYYITILGRLNENGSLDEKKLYGVGGTYLSNGTLSLNMMQEVSSYMDLSFNKGVFLVEIAIGYGETLGTAPVYRSAKYYIENLN